MTRLSVCRRHSKSLDAEPGQHVVVGQVHCGEHQLVGKEPSPGVARTAIDGAGWATHTV